MAARRPFEALKKTVEVSRINSRTGNPGQTRLLRLIYSGKLQEFLSRYRALSGNAPIDYGELIEGIAKSGLSDNQALRLTQELMHGAGISSLDLSEALALFALGGMAETSEWILSLSLNMDYPGVIARIANDAEEELDPYYSKDQDAPLPSVVIREILDRNLADPSQILVASSRKGTRAIEFSIGKLYADNLYQAYTEAFSAGNLEGSEMIIERGGPGMLSEGPLTEAASSGEEDMVNRALEQRPSGLTVAGMEASLGGHVESFMLILEKVRESDNKDYVRSFLSRCLKEGISPSKRDMTRIILGDLDREMEGEENEASKEKLSSLLVPAMAESLLRLDLISYGRVRALADEGGGLQKVDKDAIGAASSGSDIVFYTRALYSGAGIETELATNVGEALIVASKSNSLYTFRYLSSLGAINRDIWIRCIDEAAHAGNLDIINELGVFDDRIGSTHVLNIASKEGRINILQYAIENNIQGDYSSALISASRACQSSSVILIINSRPFQEQFNNVPRNVGVDLMATAAGMAAEGDCRETFSIFINGRDIPTDIKNAIIRRTAGIVASNDSANILKFLLTLSYFRDNLVEETKNQAENFKSVKVLSLIIDYEEIGKDLAPVDEEERDEAMME